jgi:hypothetical protein
MSRLKIKLIGTLPPDAPFGMRPETHFITLPSSAHNNLLVLMEQKNMSLEEAMIFVLRAGIEEAKTGKLPEVE